MSGDPMVAKLAARYLARFDTVADHDDPLRFARNLARVSHELYADEMERLRAENARLRQHVILWRGSCCPCDENPCPLAGPEDGAR